MLEKNYIDATSFFGHNYVIIMTVFIILPVDFPSKTIGYTFKCIINLNLITGIFIHLQRLYECQLGKYYYQSFFIVEQNPSSWRLGILNEILLARTKSQIYGFESNSYFLCIVLLIFLTTLQKMWLSGT